MMRFVTNMVLPLALVSTGFAPCADAEKKPRETKQEKTARRQNEKLEELAKKLARRQSMPSPAAEHAFLHARAGDLLNRASQERSDPYRFDRLTRAADSLLEASEEIFDSRKNDERTDENDRTETARELERTYFRLQQAEYFARLSGESDSGAYVAHSKRLYQQARLAYDGSQYRKAKRLGEAAEEVVDALEKLAQAAVRTPEPPRLD